MGQLSNPRGAVGRRGLPWAFTWPSFIYLRVNLSFLPYCQSARSPTGRNYCSGPVFRRDATRRVQYCHDVAVGFEKAVRLFLLLNRADGGHGGVLAPALEPETEK